MGLEYRGQSQGSGNTGMPCSAKVQRNRSFYEMWVVETLGARYRGATVLQE